MPKRKRKMTPAEQHREFVKTARALGADESEAGQERAFGKVGLRKPKKRLAAKKRSAHD